MPRADAPGLAWALGGLIVACFPADQVVRLPEPERIARRPDQLVEHRASSGVLSVRPRSWCSRSSGLILAIKVPRNWIGWIMMLDRPLDRGAVRRVRAVRAVDAPRRSCRPAACSRRSAGPFWVPLIMLAGVFLVLLFPDGHVPPGWRGSPGRPGSSMALAMAVVLTAPGPVRVPAERHEPARDPWFEPLQLAHPADPAVYRRGRDQPVQRYRRSTGTERLQLKWLAAAVSVVAVTYLIVEPLSAAVGFRTKPPGSASCRPSRCSRSACSRSRSGSRCCATGSTRSTW